MRRWASSIFVLVIVAGVTGASASDRHSGSVSATKAKAEARCTTGLKTPGIQIPFSKLKAETEISTPFNPPWIFFAESLFAPNSQKTSIEKFDAKTGKAGAPIPGVSRPCTRMISAFGSLWVPSCADGALMRLDAKTLQKKAEIKDGIAAVPGALASSPDSVWLLSDEKTTLTRIDPDQNSVIADVRLPAGCRNLAFGETALWVACPAQDRVFRIDPATNLVTKRITVSSSPQAIAIGEGSIWVLCSKDGKIDRIDPKTDKVTKTIDLGVPGATGDIVFGEGSLWVTMAGFPLTRINPTTEAVVQQFYGAAGGAIQVSTGSVWLSNVEQGTVWRIDPRRVAATLAE